jgi:sigma-E factor negative regulatory protein RseA
MFMNNSVVSVDDHELLSALADGEVSASDAAALSGKLGKESDLLNRWNTYQVIGEALRKPGLIIAGADPAFHERLSIRLSQESVASVQTLVVVSDDEIVTKTPVQSANDRNFRWKLAAGFASFSAVAAIAWAVFGTALPPAMPQLATAPTAEQLLVDSPRGPVLRDARLEELMAAHKQLGATSAQMPSGFLRNATFETPQTSIGR